MNLGKKYKQLFEGRISSNDSKLLKESYDDDERVLPFDELVDIDGLAKVNDIAGRNEQNMYEDEEEITIPLLTPLGDVEELMATVDKDAGMTSFSLFSSSIEALEAAGYDPDEFAEELKEYMF